MEAFVSGEPDQQEGAFVYMKCFRKFDCLQKKNAVALFMPNVTVFTKHTFVQTCTKGTLDAFAKPYDDR